MKSSSSIWVAIALTGFFSCSNSQPTQTATSNLMTETTSDWVVLDRGTQCGIMAPKQVLAKSQAEFDNLWREAFEGMDMPPSKPSVDFSANWVIAVFLGEKNKGGFDLDIQAIAEAGGKTTVTVKATRPGPNCMSTMSIEYPYLLASMPRRSSDKVVFAFVEETKDCN
ncbi:MAG: protease complex subunit PrcB family protein [Saprospiraceae bacterium]